MTQKILNEIDIYLVYTRDTTRDIYDKSKIWAL